MIRTLLTIVVTVLFVGACAGTSPHDVSDDVFNQTVRDADIVLDERVAVSEAKSICLALTASGDYSKSDMIDQVEKEHHSWGPTRADRFVDLAIQSYCPTAQE